MSKPDKHAIRDRFTSLDDVKGLQRSNPKFVLLTLMAAGGRFSVFDATADQRMASTLTYIEGKSGWVTRVPDKCVYPWVTVELTDAGRKAIGGNDENLANRPIRS